MHSSIFISAVLCFLLCGVSAIGNLRGALGIRDDEDSSPKLARRSGYYSSDDGYVTILNPSNYVPSLSMGYPSMSVVASASAYPSNYASSYPSNQASSYASNYASSYASNYASSGLQASQVPSSGPQASHATGRAHPTGHQTGGSPTGGNNGGNNAAQSTSASPPPSGNAASSVSSARSGILLVLGALMGVVAFAL